MGCQALIASDRYIMIPRQATFVDFETGEKLSFKFTRGGCGLGFVPANGLVYSHPHACGCYSDALRGFMGMHSYPTEEIQKLGVKISPSIGALLKQVDCVLLETNDGRPHLAQALEVIRAGKPFFVDKPIAASLEDAVAIFAASMGASLMILGLALLASQNQLIEFQFYRVSRSEKKVLAAPDQLTAPSGICRFAAVAASPIAKP